MINILITEFLDKQVLNNLNKDFNIIYTEEIWQNRDYLEKEIHNFDGIIVRNKTNLDGSILEKAVNLKYIGRLGVGLDNIDTEYCNKNNIFVQPATGMNADSVAEYVVNSSLILLKKTLIGICIFFNKFICCSQNHFFSRRIHFIINSHHHR